MRRGTGARAFAGAAAIVASLATAGCGGGDSENGTEATEPGALASFAPTETVLYADLGIRPTGDERDRVEEFAEALTGEEVDSEDLIEDIFTRLADEESEVEDLDYAEDIEPWLGDRAALWITELDGEAEEAEGAAALTVTDEAMAEEALVSAFGEEDEPLEFDGEGGSEDSDSDSDLPLIHGDADDAFAIVDGVALIGSREAIVAADSAHAALSLAGKEGFQAALERSGPGGSSLFAYVLSGRLSLAGLAGDSLPVTRREAREVLSEAGSAVNDVTVATLAVDANGAVLESETEVSDRPDIAAAREQLEALPEDSWAAVADPVQLKHFIEGAKLGAEIGLGQVLRARGLEPSPARMRTLAIRQTGVDLIAGLDRFEGSIALSVQGANPREISAQVIAPVRSYRILTDPLVAASVLIDGGTPGITFSRVRPLPPGTISSVDVHLRREPALALRLSESTDQVIVQAATAGELPPLAPPARSLAGSDRLADADAAMPEGFTALGFVDLDEVVEVFPVIAQEDEAIAGALENLALRIGARYEDGRIIQRIALDIEPEQASEAEEDAEEEEDQEREVPDEGPVASLSPPLGAGR